MEVVINVDDFGMTPGINQAVFNLCDMGIVKSTSLFVNAPFAVQGLELIENLDINCGLHLTLNMYEPCSENCNIIDVFEKKMDIAKLQVMDIYYEFKAQLEKFTKLTGKLPTHLDTHYHLHIENPNVSEATIKLAKEFKLPVRGLDENYCEMLFCSEFVGTNATIDFLENYLQGCIDSKLSHVEIMSHAALLDEHLEKYTSLIEPRYAEYEVLSSKRLQSFLEKKDIQIINYRK